MGQRSRKRGRRAPPRAKPPAKPVSKPTPRPVATATPARPAPPRGEQRNAALRAALVPLAPGERPRAITVSSVIALLSGVGNLVAYAAGAKIAGKHPAPGGIIVFSVLMIVCAGGMWKLRYWAVLGFMGLLAIIVTLFALLLIEASNLLGFVIPPIIIGGSGYLFIKLVRVLSRIQMPRYPGR